LIVISFGVLYGKYCGVWVFIWIHIYTVRPPDVNITGKESASKRFESVEDINTIALGIIIVLVFIWRFARTRQLYLTSLKIRTLALRPIVFNPRNPHDIIEQVILGRRSIKPASFFIRAFVLAVVALCLLPFKDYEPFLFWIVISMISLYVPWCIVHGVLLNNAPRSKEP